MPHLNDASNVQANVRIDKFRCQRPVEITQAQSNCSLCACAGVITHGKGELVRSGQVAQMVPTNVELHKELTIDPHMQHARTFGCRGWQGPHPDDLRSAGSIRSNNSNQIGGIVNYGSRALSLCRVLKMGDTGNGDQPRTLREAKAYMKAMADCGFIFAVLAPANGHWNFAHRVGHNIEFIDYQTDHPDLGGPRPVASNSRRLCRAVTWMTELRQC